MTGFGDKALGFILGGAVSTFICAMLIFTQDSYTWFELVKTLSALLVATSLIIATLTYFRQSKWKHEEDCRDDSKLYCEAAIDGFTKASENILDSASGIDWHIASIYFESSTVVGRNIVDINVIDIFELKKSVIMNKVLKCVCTKDEYSFSGLSESEYKLMKEKIVRLRENNFAALDAAAKESYCRGLLAHVDNMKSHNIIDISSIIEVCISASLIKHEDVYSKKYINLEHNEISPDYTDSNVLDEGMKFISKSFSECGLFGYINTVKSLNDLLVICGNERNITLIGK